MEEITRREGVSIAGYFTLFGNTFCTEKLKKTLRENLKLFMSHLEPDESLH